MGINKRDKTSQAPTRMNQPPQRQWTTWFLAWVLAALAPGCGGGGGTSNADAPPANSTTTTSTSSANSSSAATVTPAAQSSSVSSVELHVVIGGTGLHVVIGGTGLHIGSFDHRGSIIINDTTLSTANADFAIEGRNGVEADLKIGQELLVIVDASSDEAINVRYRSNLKGPVSTAGISLETGTGQIEILGQTVNISSATVVKNLLAEEIQVDDLLEVSGHRDAFGQINASFIEKHEILNNYKLTGVVANLSERAFTIAAQEIDFSNATLQGFTDPQVTNGDVVEVRIAPINESPSGVLEAEFIELLPILTASETATLQIEGSVDRFVSVTEFDINGQPISVVNATELINGDAADLSLNAKLDVAGRINSAGILVADQITFLRVDGIEARGQIEAIDNASQVLRILGVNFVVRHSTRFVGNGNSDAAGLDRLQLGDYAHTRGFVDGTTAVAMRIGTRPNRDDSRLKGNMTNINPARASFDVLGVSITTDSMITLFSDADGNSITQEEFFQQIDSGTLVTVRWDPFSTTDTYADRVTLHTNDGD